MFAHLLVPLDGSALAESALPAAIALAQRLPAGITLLHVVEPHAAPTVHGDRHLTSAQGAAEYLEQVVARLAAQRVQAASIVGSGSGNVAGAIAEAAATEGADLIVLCTHGRGGLRDVLFGSVAQQVLQQGTTPVLLVKPGGAADEFLYRRVMVPLDGSDAAATALPAALTVARAWGAAVVLVSVVPTPETAPPERAATRLMPTAAAEVLDLEAQHQRDYLAGVAAQLAAEGLTAEAVVERGETVRTLLLAAQSRRVDVIVMATHGRSGLAGAWAGSVASRIIGHVAVPVLLIRIPAS